MRAFFTSAILVLFLATFPLHFASAADQNPVPTNVGLINFSTFVVSTGTSIVVLPRRETRAGLIIQNNGSVSVVVKPGSTPTSPTDGMVLPAGTLIQFVRVPVDALYAKAVSASASVIMIEEVK